MERRADDFQRLKERAKESLLRMKRAGDLERLAQEMRTADRSRARQEEEAGKPPTTAKQRALQSLLEMKRSGELQLLAEEIGFMLQQHILGPVWKVHVWAMKQCLYKI